MDRRSALRHAAGAAITVRKAGVVGIEGSNLHSIGRRRMVVTILAACIGARAGFALAQAPPRLPLVALISTGTEEFSRRQNETLLLGMQQRGQIEGRTFRFQVRYADGDTTRFPALLRQSLAEEPVVIVVVGLIAARAARDATSTVPVVVATASDLVDAGIVKSHAQPGGNITGVSDLTDESAAKRLELLKAALPNAKRVALLVNPDFPATPKIEARVETIARAAGITITPVYMNDRASLLRAVDALGKSRPDALLVGGDPIATTFRSELIERALALAIPVIHYWPDSAERGALISLQVDISDNFMRAAGYVDRILKGARPADLPIQLPSRYELVVNAKTAKAMGITLPQSLLLRADRVIQ